MGQEREVTTITLYVRDSFEEVSYHRKSLFLRSNTTALEQVVVKNQQLKRELASILLGSSKSEVKELGLLEVRNI